MAELMRGTLEEVLCAVPQRAEELKETMAEVWVLPRKRVVILVQEPKPVRQRVPVREQVPVRAMYPEAWVGGQALDWQPEPEWRLEKEWGEVGAKNLIENLAMPQALKQMMPAWGSSQGPPFGWDLNPGREQKVEVDRLRQELKSILMQMIEEAQ